MPKVTNDNQAPSQMGQSENSTPSEDKPEKTNPRAAGKKARRRKTIGLSVLAVAALVAAFFLGRFSVRNVSISIGGTSAAESQDGNDIPTTEGEVGTPIVRDNYEFTVESYDLLPEGEGDLYSSSDLKEQDSREFHIDMSTKSKWQYSFEDMRMSVHLPEITINGKYKYQSTTSRSTGGQAGGIGHEILCFTIPNDVVNSADSIDFDYELNEDPSDKTGGTFAPTQTSEGTKLDFTTPKHTVRYHFKLK